MKKSEIAMIILIAGVSMAVTFFLMQSILGDKTKRETTIKVVDPISSEDKSPSKRIFNSDAINPTVEIYLDNDVVSDGKAQDNEAFKAEK